MWGHVTANEHDPLQQGRIQVEFEWEHLDPQPSGDRAWLHQVTPYGGGHEGGKKASAYSGFYSVPEVGERVLVEFLGDWDSEAVILGTVRHNSQKTTFNPKHTKRWATPSGNEVTMTTRGNNDVVRIRARNQMILDAHVSGGKHVSLMCHGSEADSLQIDVGDQAGTIVKLVGSNDMVIYTTRNMLVEGDQDVTIQAGNNMLIAAQNNLTIQSKTLHLHSDHLLVEAAGHLHMQGTTAQVQSGPGQVHVDGPTVMLNTGALPKPEFDETVAPASG